MAKRPAKTTAGTTATHDPDEIPPAMDYAAHNATYTGFMRLLKWSILALGVTLVALYFFIEGQQPLIGTLLLLAIPVGALAAVIMNARRV